jgi:Cu-processing system permease protein
MTGRFSVLQPITTIAGITVQEGMKTRLLPLVLGVLVLGVVLASFAGSLATTEGDQIQSALLGSYLRFAGVLLSSLFVLNSQVREFNDKGLDLVLALPVPRGGYFFGKLVGFALIALQITMLFTFVLLFYSSVDQVALWGVSLFFELLIVITLSLLCLFTFSQVPAAFISVFAIYILSRSVSSLILVGQGPIMPHRAIINWLMNQTMEGLAFVLPALDRFTSSEWLVYGTGTLEDLLFVASQGVIYVALLSAAALIDFYKKNL